MKPPPTPWFRKALLRWYDASHRLLPWRVEYPDPYAIWVAETMLQQTQVATVLPYWSRFLAEFPSVSALAAAPVDRVLQLWSGLGYYRRAHHLHAAARRVVSDFSGVMPRDPDQLRTLPGVGSYTAGAVASIAFGVRAAAVDGNVRRIFRRLLTHPQSSRGKTHPPSDAEVSAAAERLVPAQRPGDFNQALMELGALVCVPRNPRCGACPVRQWCGACAAGLQHDSAKGRRPTAKPDLRVAALVVRRHGRVLLQKRPDTGLWSGLYDLPQREVGPRGDGHAAAQAILLDLGLRGEVSALGSVTRQLSHRTFKAEVFCLARPAGKLARRAGLRWADSNLPSPAVSAATRAMLRLAGSGTAAPRE